MAFPRRAADESRGHTGLAQVRGLFLDDVEVERSVVVKRRVRGGDEAAQAL